MASFAEGIQLLWVVQNNIKHLAATLKLEEFITIKKRHIAHSVARFL
jgi:hypothetical protein